MHSYILPRFLFKIFKCYQIVILKLPKCYYIIAKSLQVHFHQNVNGILICMIRITGKENKIKLVSTYP
jgi:hypothetical protein